MIKRDELVGYLDNYLDINAFKDGYWNGLQVEGKSEINKIITAVDAGITTFEKAIEQQADMVIVHHGHFSKKNSPTLVGWKKKRIKMLLEHDISLYVSHLPLDGHPEVGNNAQLIRLLGAEKDQSFVSGGAKNISWTANFAQPKPLQDIVSLLNRELATNSIVLPYGPENVSTMAICTGGGGFGIFEQALNTGTDLYISGDPVDIAAVAKDAHFNVIFSGHYATETLGVKALANHLTDQFDVQAEFVDVPVKLAF